MGYRLRSQEENQGLAPRARVWQSNGAGQVTRLAVFAATLLGRADSDRALREVRDGAGPGERIAADSAGVEGLHPHRQCRAAVGEGDGVGEHEMPAVRRAGEARDQYDAAMGRQLLV